MSEPKLLSPVTVVTSAQVFDTAIYIGLFVFVLALPFGYSTAFLNIGLSLVLFGWVGRMVSERKLGWRRTPLDLPIALFLGLALIASLFAPHPSTSSLGYFWKLLRAILLFYAVVHSRLGTRWRHIVIAFILAAAVSSALGLWYYVHDTRLALDFMGRIGLQFQKEFTTATGFSDALRAELRTCRVPLSETAFHVTPEQPDTWRIDDPVRDRRYTVRKGETHLMVYMIEQRLTGTFKMPNDLGAYLALSLPFVIGYFAAGFRRSLQKPECKTGNNGRWIAIRCGMDNADIGNHRSLDERKSRLDLDACGVGECDPCNHLQCLLPCPQHTDNKYFTEARRIGIGFNEPCVLRATSEYKHSANPY